MNMDDHMITAYRCHAHVIKRVCNPHGGKLNYANNIVFAEMM